MGAATCYYCGAACATYTGAAATGAGAVKPPEAGATGISPGYAGGIGGARPAWFTGALTGFGCCITGAYGGGYWTTGAGGY